MLLILLALTVVDATDSRFDTDTGNTIDCFDTTPSCEELARLGYCPRNRLVREKCPVSCAVGCAAAPEATAPPTTDATEAPDEATEAPTTDAPTDVTDPLCNSGDPSCCDTVDTCQGFKDAGACDRGSLAIQTICRNTCGFCEQAKVCAKSTFDCYSQQMDCATQLREQESVITPDALIACVLPKANALGRTDPEHCCYKFTLYQQHCQNPDNTSNCECQSYDDFFSEECSPGVAAATFSLRHAVFKNGKSCENSSDKGARNLIDAYSYTMELEACNVLYPYGSAFLRCGSEPGTINMVEYQRSGCRGQDVKDRDIAPHVCVPKNNKKAYERFVFDAPSKCGVYPPEPTDPPVEKAKLKTFSKWRNYCKKTKSDEESCISCGGKWKSNRGMCKVSKDAANTVKCRRLSQDVCEPLGCVFESEGRQMKCTGDIVQPSWN